MRTFPAICLTTFSLTGFLSAGLAAAAEPQPTGEWRTANGLANIRIDDCNGVLWGVISWEKTPGGLDRNNPNPAERNHPTFGLHILQAMKPTQPGLWEGQIYNPENGQTYESRISLAAPDVLKVEGCVLGFLCGGENWTRVKAEASPPPHRQPAAQRRTSKPKDAPPPAPPLTACSGLPDKPK